MACLYSAIFYAVSKRSGTDHSFTCKYTFSS